jgi:hypothetical protein
VELDEPGVSKAKMVGANECTLAGHMILTLDNECNYGTFAIQYATPIFFLMD